MTAMPLEQLVEALRGGVISLLSDGAAAEWRVTGAELLDHPEALATTAPGHLLLGVGLDVADRDALGAALRTAADRSCALAVKCPTPPPPEVSAQVATTRVPVLAVDPQMPWTRVQRLVTTILTARAAVAEPSGGATGGDLFSLANDKAVGVVDIWRRVEALRKRPWRQAQILGLGMLVRYVTGRLSLRDAAERLGRLAGVRAAIVQTPFGLASVDVDKPSDLDLVRRIVGD